MDPQIIWKISERANAGAISLIDFVAVLLAADIARVRVDLVRKDACFFGLDDSFITLFLPNLKGIRSRKSPELSGALQALERSRLDRISYADFVIRIARSGYSSFAIFSRQNIISFEGRRGESLSLPILLIPGSDEAKWD